MALTGENKQLWDGPYDFLKNHSVSPQDNHAVSFQVPGMEMSEGFKRAKEIQEKISTFTPADPVAGRDNHQVVADKARICYGNLVVSLQYPNAFDLKIYIKKHGEKEGRRGLDLSTMVPLYYLPWQSGKLVRMQIPAKQNLADRNASWDDRDPNIFFTAAISGCSVFVSGTRQSPVVHHGGYTKGTLAHDIDDAKTHWRTLFNQLQPLARTNWKSNVNFGEVHKKQYISKATVPMPAPGKYQTADGRGLVVGQGEGSTSFQTATSKAYGEWFDTNAAGWNFKIADLQPWGAVFGIRDAGGDWSFYLQENCTVTTLKRSWVMGDWFAHRETLPLAMRQFFPGDGGHVVPERSFRVVGA